MRKNILSIAALLLLLSACGGKKAPSESADAVVNDSTAILAQEEITSLINELYAAAAKNAGDIDYLYACNEWRKTVAAVEEVDSKLAEIGFFNEDYWTEMQDDNPDGLEARDIRFEQLDVEKGTATVSFILHSSVQTIRRKFIFCQDDGNWRIHDIVRFYDEPDGEETSYSLMESMQSYLNDPHEEMQ